MITMKKIGVLYGQENTFPFALIDKINQMGVPGIVAEAVQIDKVMQGEASGYAVIIDRISQDIPFYRAYLKNAAITGTAVINNPFWWSADEKFFNNCLAIQVGVPVPRTVLLPSNQMPPDTNANSFRNLKYPMDWDGIAKHIGFPAYMKPHSGGGWKSVYRVESLDDLFAKHNETGDLVMMLQEEIVFEEYYRCYCIGGKYVRIMQYEPRNPHHLRYVVDTPPSSQKLLNLIEDYVLRLNKALGYDFNTVEFAVRDGVPYAIDFCNPAPDADVNSVGQANFDWVVETSARYAIERALAQKPGQDNLTWGTFVQQGAAGAMQLTAAPVRTGKRGRPAKAKTATAVKPAGKRGRPAKPKAAADSVAKPAGKRGRPAKPKTAADAVAKPAGKRGRPAKPKTEVVAKVAGKRGRPAKTEVAAKPAGKRGRPAKAVVAKAAETSPKLRKGKAALTDGKKVPGKRGRKPKPNKVVRQKRVKIEKPFGDLMGIDAVLAAEKLGK